MNAVVLKRLLGALLAATFSSAYAQNSGAPHQLPGGTGGEASPAVLTTNYSGIGSRGAVPGSRNGGAPAYHASQVLVKFRPGASASADALLPGSGRPRGFGYDRDLFVVPNPPGLSVPSAISRYKSNPNVLYAEPDYEVKTATVPTDPLWSQQWDMQIIAAPQAWSIFGGASSVIVAVIDTGIDFTHLDLQGNLWTNTDGSHGFTCMNGLCGPGGADDNGHGTHVAGTIGAVGNNGVGMAGINWRAQLLACKFLGPDGSGNVSDAILCFNQILALKQQGYNVRVTNSSWGGGGYSQALKDAMSAVESAGIVNVCAAGNSGLNADVAPMYPGAYDNRGIVSVLASDSSDLGASFSNYGMANVDIAAPGVSTLSTVPTGTCTLCDPSGYRLLSGTSMATPHVTGVLAAMLQLHPELTAYLARDAVLNPASYDPLSGSRGSMTSTGGRLNFYKAITNPFLAAPVLNGFPTLAPLSSVSAGAGGSMTLTASASDPDNDPLRLVWSRGALNATPGIGSLWLLGSVLGTVFPVPAGNPFTIQAPAVARTVVAPYLASVSDGKGGGMSALAYATILPAAGAAQSLSGTLSVSPLTGPAGTTVSVNFPVTSPAGGPVYWDLWMTGAGTGTGLCCQSTSSTSLQINQAGAYRITTQAIDSRLNFSDRQSAVVRIGGATGTPPVANAVFDKLSGPAPLTVNIDMSSSYDPDGVIQSYVITCQYGTIGVSSAGPTGSCAYNAPGNYWIMLQVKDSDGLIDVLTAYAVVTPATGTTSKQTASVVLGNLTQTYTGGTLTPTATTTPAGLAIAWSGAPQTNAGSYQVTATIVDPNYQGSASGTFTINRAPASATLSNLTQGYTGSSLSPAATTTPAGLAIAWSGAPQTNAGSYPVTATIVDPNYQGSASGTFTITAQTASTPPSVSITSPAPGPVKVKQVVTIAAAVTSGSYPVARVDFLVNGQVQCSDSAAPYGCAWSVPASTGKSYQLQAKAYDTAGQVGLSAIVTVTSSR